MDLMHVNSDKVLHIVDEVMRLSAAQFVQRRVIAEKVWETITQCW